MDIEADLEGLDLKEITNRFSLTLPLKGKASARARIRGQAQKPEMEISASVPELAVSGLLFKEVQVSGKAASSGETFHIREARALVGDSPVTGNGTILRGKEGWELAFSMEGSKLDLQNLVPRFISGSREIVKGLVDAKVSGRINADGFQGSGRVKSPSLELWGFRLTGADIPFVTTDEFVTVESGTALAYGGEVKVLGSVEMGKARWGGRMTVSGADLAPALKDALKTEGTVSGKADLSFRIANEYGKAFLMDGSGSLRVKDGAVEGFEALKSLIPITGSPSIRYSTVNANFNIDGKSVFLLPGTRANAVPGDRFYRYLSVDGSIGEGGNLDLKSYGEINIRGLNLLLGGLEGLLSSDGSWSTATLQQFLGGILGGAARRDFQAVSFNLKGPWRKPTIGDLKVIQHPKESPIPTSPSDPSGKEDRDDFRITITIPTGEGGSKSSGDAGSQIKDQLLEQVIRQILKPETDN
jgi:translocation and assembly module TamB